MRNPTMGNAATQRKKFEEAVQNLNKAYPGKKPLKSKGQ